MSDYDLYLNDSLDQLKEMIENMECRPILFIGAGLSQRYINGPNWEGLMELLIEQNPNLSRPYAFYLQEANNVFSDDEVSEANYPIESKVASLLIDEYREYAWDNRSEDNIFSQEIYSRDYDGDIFLKYAICNLFDKLLEKNKDEIDKAEDYDSLNAKEIELLSEINPHAIITTNYDQLLEKIFPNYKPVVGEQVIRENLHNEIGEILKIHGCVTAPESIVISKEDYSEFINNKKYLSAKLLTYFIEYPVIILGYSISDSNIKKILNDISKMLPKDYEDNPVENIWFVEWEENIDKDNPPPTDKLINLGENSIRLNYLKLEKFSELYKIIAEPTSANNVDIKTLRNIAANFYNIIKSRSAKSLKVNYVTLDNLANEENLKNVLGFGEIKDPEIINRRYPYRITKIANKLGYDGIWNYVQQLIDKIEEKTGFDIKASYNNYHIDVSTKEEHTRHRYSEEAVRLLRKVKNKDPYTVITDQGEKIEVGSEEICKSQIVISD